MSIKKIRRKTIKVSPGTRRQIAAEYGVSVQTVGNALRYRTEGQQPELMRLRALELGGVETIDVKVIDY